jgi:uncharacterized repeat protein (TIGR01451 family)
VASPGDTLLYQVIIWNEGTIDATGVTFSDTLDPNTTLVVGSVTTTKGIVTVGNSTGDASVEVDVGTLLAGGQATETVTITFQVTVNDPLPAGVTHVYNQGLFLSNEAPPEPTDDPDTPLIEDDPTGTPIEGPGPPSGVPVLPGIHFAIAAALGAGILAYLVRRRLVDQVQLNAE